MNAGKGDCYGHGGGEEVNSCAFICGDHPICRDPRNLRKVAIPANPLLSAQIHDVISFFTSTLCHLASVSHSHFCSCCSSFVIDYSPSSQYCCAHPNPISPFSPPFSASEAGALPPRITKICCHTAPPGCQRG